MDNFLQLLVAYAAGLAVYDQDGFNGWVLQGFVKNTFADPAGLAGDYCFDFGGHRDGG